MDVANLADNKSKLKENEKLDRYLTLLGDLTFELRLGYLTLKLFFYLVLNDAKGTSRMNYLGSFLDPGCVAFVQNSF